MRIAQILAGKVPTYKNLYHKFVLVLLVAPATMVGAAVISANADVQVPAAEGSANSASPLMVKGRLVSRYGIARDPFNTGYPRKHKGIDIAAPTGTSIFAPDDGIVVVATDLYNGQPAYGKVIIIETANKTRTLLAHLDDYDVSKGQAVSKGAKIASIGNTGKSTGPHVHIETRVSGKRVDPLTVWYFDN